MVMPGASERRPWHIPRHGFVLLFGPARAHAGFQLLFGASQTLATLWTREQPAPLLNILVLLTTATDTFSWSPLALSMSIRAREKQAETEYQRNNDQHQFSHNQLLLLNWMAALFKARAPARSHERPQYLKSSPRNIGGEQRLRRLHCTRAAKG